MEKNIKKELIRKFFVDRGVFVSDSENLFESGAIDSMGILELVTFLEEKFNTNLPSNKMISNNFMTLNAIFSLIENENG